jgi:hypothetical protein
MTRGKPINVRPGRTTVVTLPSGEEVSFEPEQAKGHLLLRITAPEGSRINHRKADEAESDCSDAI